MKINKIKAREKIALAVFMEAVPKIIELWKSRAADITFDEFCLQQYELAKKNKS